MDIIPLGHASFRIKGKQAVIVCDPFNPDKVGLKLPKNITADIVTISHAHFDHNFHQAVAKQAEERILLSGPGEYEIKGVGIIGVATFHDTKEGQERGKNIVFKFEMEGINIVHCGDLGHKLTDGQIEEIDGADILLIPVGGFYTIDAKVAVEVVKQLEPSIVIPMHYGRDGLVPDLKSKLASLSEFMKEIGVEEKQAESKLVITKDKLPEEMQVVVLE